MRMSAHETYAVRQKSVLVNSRPATKGYRILHAEVDSSPKSHKLSAAIHGNELNFLCARS